MLSEISEPHPFVAFAFRHSCGQILIKVVPTGVALAASAVMGAWIIHTLFAAAPESAPGLTARRSLPPLPPIVSASTETVTPDAAPLDFGPSSSLKPVSLAPEAPDASIRPATSPLMASPSASQPPLKRLASPPPLAPSPPPRPVNLVSRADPPVFPRRLAQGIGNSDALPASSAMGQTAVYDLAAHTVYLPDGTTLEAHSGLGDRLDDPSHVDERNRGATPPHLYNLTPREQPFHGVEALRLNPVGGSGIFGRVGLLAHSYMLGANGDSNGCVSFKNYDAFLQAFKTGLVKRLAVVASLNDHLADLKIGTPAKVSTGAGRTPAGVL